MNFFNGPAEGGSELTAGGELSLGDGVALAPGGYSDAASVKLAMSARRRGVKPKAADSSLDPLTFGDLVVLRSQESGTSGGLLVGDAASLRLGTQQPEPNSRDALNFNEAVYRLVPMLAYRQQNELAVALALREAERPSGGGTGDRSRAGGRSRDTQLALLRKRSEAGRRTNEEVMAAVMSGTSEDGSAHTVNFGDSIQLQHVKSGFFVTVLDEAAPFDRECRATVLRPDGSR